MLGTAPTAAAPTGGEAPASAVSTLSFSMIDDASGRFSIDAATGVVHRVGTVVAGQFYSITWRVADSASGKVSSRTELIRVVPRVGSFYATQIFPPVF